MMNPEEIRGKWIWYSGEEQPKNFYLLLRKRVDLPSSVRRAFLRVTADSRYRLFFNGVAVARGPARCDRRWQCLDEWDVSPWLRQGENVVAATVHHYGTWTFAYMLGRGGFLADGEIELADGRILPLLSDESWRVQVARAWERRLPRMSIQQGYPELYDARLEVPGWNRPAFNDSDWERASILGPAGMEPWSGFALRQIPALRELPLQPQSIVDAGEVDAVPNGHTIDLRTVQWCASNGVAYLSTFVHSAIERDVHLQAGGREALRLWINDEMVIRGQASEVRPSAQEVLQARLHAGWNTLLAKVVQGEGPWEFFFRFAGEDSANLAYSSSHAEEALHSIEASPWMMLAPFESPSVAAGLEGRYPPEEEINFSRTYRGQEGREIRWISAGPSAECLLPSALMSRERRSPSRMSQVENSEGLLRPGIPAVFRPGPVTGQYVVIDFGREVAGYPVLEIQNALGGEIIDLGYGEVLQSPEGEVISPVSGRIGMVNPERDGVHYADRYLCRSGRQRFETFDRRAFRYLQLDVRNVTGPLAIGPISVRSASYPVEQQGSFRCSDPLLERIWQTGCRTVELNMEDAYTDCPWRERGQWWGDARVEALVNYYAFGDLELIRQGLRQIAQSQNETGITMGVYPTEWSYGILPTFTLLWIISLQDYVRFSGDRDLGHELFPAVERALSFFASYRSEHNLLRDVSHWLFVDWAKVETSGESSSVNALYHGALQAAAGLAGILDRTDLAKEFQKLATLVREAMLQYLWDDRAGCFCETWKSDHVVRQISEQANCWAVVFDVVRGEQAESILHHLFREGRADVQVGTPYFGFYVLMALARGKCHAEALSYLRKNWGAMLDWGATTWWEQWEPRGSFCHGWSAGPTAFLQSEILGIRPGEKGWEEILIEPHIGDLRWAGGSVPTPIGTVAVEWKVNGDFTMLLEAPSRSQLSVPRLEHGVLRCVGPNGETIEKRVDQSAHEITLELPSPGQYRILSQ